MSTLQFRLIAALIWLLAAMGGSLGAYNISEYVAFRFGERVQATVVEDEAGTALGRATLAYDSGGRRTTTLWEAGLRPGDTADLYVRASGHARRVEKVQLPLLPLIFVGLASLALTAAGVYLWRRPTLAARRRATWSDPLDVIVAAVARSRNVSLGGGVMFVLFAAFLGLLAWLASDGGAAERIAVAALALVSLGLAALFLLHARQLRDPRHNHIIALIERNPAEIAWFYVHKVGGGARSSLAIHIWRTNGKCIALNMVREEQDQALAELARRAPHAPRTFSGETLRLYRADPTRWRPTAS